MARDGKKLGLSWDPLTSVPTLSQPGLFQTFASQSNLCDDKSKNHVVHYYTNSFQPSFHVFLAGNIIMFLIFLDWSLWPT